MHIPELVYQLTSKMPCVVECPWLLAPQHTRDAERALCHVLLVVTKDKTRLCECHTPPEASPLLKERER